MDLRAELRCFISERFNASRPIADDQSLLYSGMIDSLGIQELVTFLSGRCGRELVGTEIVEKDLDTVNLLAAWALGNDSFRKT